MDMKPKSRNKPKHKNIVKTIDYWIEDEIKYNLLETTDIINGSAFFFIIYLN